MSDAVILGGFGLLGTSITAYAGYMIAKVSRSVGSNGGSSLHDRLDLLGDKFDAHSELDRERFDTVHALINDIKQRIER